MRSLMVAIFALIFTGCESQPQSGPAPEPPRSATPTPTEKGPRATPKGYGAPIRVETPVALGAVLASPETYQGRTVVVEGEVRRACSRKGCWMEIAESMSAQARGARVTFKDYGFFVPTNSAGSHAKLEGMVNVELMKAAQVEHLEGEGAKFPDKNADGTVREVQFVANGVELTRVD